MSLFWKFAWLLSVAGNGSEVEVAQPAPAEPNIETLVPHYLKHPAQYFPPTPAYPLPKELTNLDEAAAKARADDIALAAAEVKLLKQTIATHEATIDSLRRDLVAAQASVETMVERCREATKTIQQAHEELARLRAELHPEIEAKHNQEIEKLFKEYAVLHKTGNLKEAYVVAKQIVELEPGHAAAQTACGELRIRLLLQEMERDILAVPRLGSVDQEHPGVPPLSSKPAPPQCPAAASPRLPMAPPTLPVPPTPPLPAGGVEWRW